MSDLEQQLLEEGKRALNPTSAQRDALRARIDRALAAPPAPAPGLSTVHVAALMGVAILGAWLAWPREASEPSAAPGAVAVDSPVDTVPAADETPAEAPVAEGPVEVIAPREPVSEEPATPVAPTVTGSDPIVAPVEARPTPVDTLDAELRLLGEARRALGRGAPGEALEPLEAHQRSFREGVLREEREALFVRALCEAGEIAQGTRRLAAFEREHPSSVALSALRESCAE